MSVYYGDTRAGSSTLTPSDGALGLAPSQTETITPAAAAALVVHTQPSSSATAGVAFVTQPVIYEEDQYGNVETGDSNTVVSASLASRRRPAPGYANSQAVLRRGDVHDSG